MPRKLLKVLPELVLLIGLVVFILGASQYFQAKRSSLAAGSNSNLSPAIIERQAAIDEALRQGKKEYSYTTNFIPGLGRVGDTDAYKKQLEAEGQELLQKSSN